NSGKGIHRNCKQDHIHSFKCKVGPDPSYRGDDCAREHYENSYDKPVVFKCPHNGFITGIRSEYNTHHKDRRFGFRCCHTDRYMPNKCKIAPLQNNWDQKLKYKLPRKYYLVGAFSDHDNHYE
ncbi:hemagglutinin/amebocyte aggregation factor-like, partial [Stylophora pistillata]|uniref:hemagglutinin/amebocyte aggregation factor-like n=1 Tax=Stylophora pistillata TaxID=50429 RepID=UPI000C043ABC